MYRIILVVFAMVATSAYAAPSDCNPLDFKDVDFSHLRDSAKMTYLSRIDSATFDADSKRFQGHMTIPYINVPAGHDLSTAQSQVRQLQNLLDIQTTEEQEKTILHVSWSEIGLEAYTKCLKGDPLVLKAFMASTDDEEFDLDIHWEPGDPNSVGTIETLEISGASPIDALGRKIGHAKSTTVHIRRTKNAAERVVRPLSVTVQVNGVTRNFNLPRPPKRFVIGDIDLQEFTFAQASDEHNLTVAREKKCYFSREQQVSWSDGTKGAVDGQQFLIASAEPSAKKTSASTDSVDVQIARDDGARLCLTGIASGGPHNGVSGSATANVELIKVFAD
jgi:hypothetical protein